MHRRSRRRAESGALLRDLETGKGMGRRAILSSLAVGGVLPLWHARRPLADARSATIAFPIDIPDWDPMVNNTPTTSSIVKCVFDAPVDLSPDLKLIPMLATGCRWLDAKGLVFQIDLRDGVD